ncbi:threonine synthase [Sulfurospirillum arcachonense]|uniref:threonine synthase n=1 Tax=Sulfurospirillum arcachonense TaxID=57666 RepID=UPI0004682FE8|nr:threonine synthase [Sulfurospirillum arcachonense]
MFIETRGNDGKKKSKVEFSYAIMNPSASFGGLYVPENLPKIDLEFLQLATQKSYKQITLDILELFNIDIDKDVLEDAVKLYDNFDDKNNPVPLAQIKNDLFVNELYHGPTRAFKDMALQPFGHILSDLAKKQNQEYLILAATSGDTGPATLDTFANKENIKVACLYPSGGTSDVQRLQMVTEAGKNLKVIGIEGNFDDAQNALKNLLASASFKEELVKDNIKLSAANSVNFGRIIFQIIYHVFAYISLLKQNRISLGESFYQIVPSGNFGNALGAYYAKKMGLPIEKILIASNINNILTDLITKGEYDLRERELFLTTSPAMDILISSNVERVLFDKYGASRTKEMMEELKENKYYKLSDEELKELQKDFSAVYCDDNFAKNTIKEFANDGYIMDPHTATCIKAYNELKEKNIPSVLCSTAEWTKFAPTMFNAINNDNNTYSDKEALKGIHKSLHVKIPESINSLFEKEILHDKVVDKQDIEESILGFIKGN